MMTLGRKNAGLAAPTPLTIGPSDQVCPFTIMIGCLMTIAGSLGAPGERVELAYVLAGYRSFCLIFGPWSTATLRGLPVARGESTLSRFSLRNQSH